MNQKTLLSILKPLCSLLIHSYIILFFLLTRTTSSVDPKFEACQPKFCGNHSISYPFYIEGIQQPFCGYPGFGLSCDKNVSPILNLSNTLYIIDQIFYQNQSLRVSNAVFSTSNTNTDCLSPTQNLTLLGNMFQLAPNQKDVTLFFGCDSPSLPIELKEHIIGCSNDNRTSSVLALYKDDKNRSFVSKNCKGVVVDATVEDDDGEGGIQEALRKGFLLKWKVSDCSLYNSTGGMCGYGPEIHTFRCYCTDGVHAWKCDPATKKKGLNRNAKLGIVALVGVVVAVLIVLACCFRTKIAFFLFQKENPIHRIIEEFLKEHGPLPAARYSYSDVKKITNSFRDKLGQGGYGCVYKGKLHDGRVVAVKILSKSKGEGEEFINEVASISKTSHVNIVRLLGFCLDSSERALIYEFMPNGSLEKFIYEEKNPLQVSNQLDCKTLYDIAIGVARGLEYLHRGCNTRILHFDIKPHNILLDVTFEYSSNVLRWVRLT